MKVSTRFISFLTIFFLVGLLKLSAQNKEAQALVEFDHLYTVIPDSVYRKILSHPFILAEFSNIDKGRPAFDPIDTIKKEAYFRFLDSYFELLSTANKWDEPVHKLGLGWVNNSEGSQSEIESLLKKEYRENAMYVRENDSSGTQLFGTYYIKPSDSTIFHPVDYWIYDYAPFFLEKIYGKQGPPMDITGKKYRLRYYGADKLIKDICEIGLLLTPEEATPLVNWLSTIGYSIGKKEKSITLEKDQLLFTITINEQVNKLRYLKFSHNRKGSVMKIDFSHSCILEVGEEQSTWWF